MKTFSNMNHAKNIVIKYNEQGLVPAIVQDYDSNEILMLAYMNPTALQLTLETGQAHFWSRSRQELWHKGATSGNFLNIVAMRIDCDRDTLLLLVCPDGPACHTGNRSCFFNEITTDQNFGNA